MIRQEQPQSAWSGDVARSIGGIHALMRRARVVAQSGAEAVGLVQDGSTGKERREDGAGQGAYRHLLRAGVKGKRPDGKPAGSQLVGLWWTAAGWRDRLRPGPADGQDIVLSGRDKGLPFQVCRSRVDGDWPPSSPSSA